jgi:N-acetyl-anhydromuramyl-L-alanine amidase AmpD
MVQTNKIDYDLDFTNLSERDVTNFIVIHHTGGAAGDDFSAEEIHQMHLNNGWAGAGYHFIIRKNGNIEIGRPVWAIGSHAYGFNAQSIGIHIGGNFEEEEPTAAQIESTAMLIAELCVEYDLPIDRDHVLGHYQLNATACPGKNVIAILDDIVGKANWYNENYEGTTQKKTKFIEEAIEEEHIEKESVKEELVKEEPINIAPQETIKENLIKETLPEVNEVINEVVSPEKSISKEDNSEKNILTENKQQNIFTTILTVIQEVIKTLSNLFKK